MIKIKLNVPEEYVFRRKPISARQQKSGVYFGEKKGVINSLLRLCGADRSAMKPMDEDGNAAIVGGSGSGKTSGIVKHTLCRTWAGRFLAVDIKGDLQAAFNRANPDSVAKVFSLRGDVSATYDPFDFPRQDGDENLVSNIKELVNALAPLPIDVRDPVWIASAREILTGAMLYYYNLELTFIDAIINIMSTSPGKLIEKIGASEDKDAKIFINNFLDQNTLSDSKFLMGIAQEITNRLSIFATDPRVYHSLVPSENQIRWTDLETHNIFLSVPEDRLEQYSPVITLMATQSIRALERRPEKYSPEGANSTPVLLMLDEFPRLGKMDVLASAMSTLRSKNVTFCLVVQSLAQIDQIYGSYARRILFDNCAYKAVLNVGDYESQQYFSGLAGTIVVNQVSGGIHYNPASGIPSCSMHISKSTKPAIEPHEFASLKDIVLFTTKGHTRIRKVPYHKEGFISRVWEKVVGIFRRIKVFFSRARGVNYAG